MSVEKHRHFLSFYSLYSESFKSFKGTVSVILSAWMVTRNYADRAPGLVAYTSFSVSCYLYLHLISNNKI